MNIYIINKAGEVVNVSNSHLEIRQSLGGKWSLVGLVEDMSKVYGVQEFCSEKCARDVLNEIINEIKKCAGGYSFASDVIVDLRKECKCDGESERCKKEHKDTKGGK